MPSEDLAPPPGFPTDDAIEAYGVVAELWAALAADDDQRAQAVLFGPTMVMGGMTLDGLAEQLRQRMNKTREECSSMGVSTTVRILPDGAWVFFSMPAWRLLIFDAPTQAFVVAWVVVRHEDGTWRCWGAPDPDDVARATLVQLPIIPPSKGVN